MKQTKKYQPKMRDVEAQTKRFAKAHKKLEAALAKLNAQIQKAKKKHYADLETLAGVAGIEKGRLATLITLCAELFKEPRTQVFHSVKVGLRQEALTVGVPDEKATIDAIRKEFPARFKELVDTVESVKVSALKTLNDEDLAKVHAVRLGGNDTIVIKPAGSDVDKAIAAILKDAAEEAVDFTAKTAATSPELKEAA